MAGAGREEGGDSVAGMGREGALRATCQRTT